MSSDIEREERYIVIKRKHLHGTSEGIVRQLLQDIQVPTVECVVVEHDWPNYDHVWQTIQQVADGTWQAARAQKGEADPVAIETLKRVRDWWANCDGDMPASLEADIAAALKMSPTTTAVGAPEGLKDTLNRLANGLDNLKDNARDEYDRNYIKAMLKDVDAILTAAPSPEQPKPRNRYGVDAPYFHGKLSIILRDMESYTPDELARSLARLALVADKDVLDESEFTQEQGQAAPGSGWLKVIENNCWDLRCTGEPTGGGDFDVVWHVIEHHMAEPKERTLSSSLCPIRALELALNPPAEVPGDE